MTRHKASWECFLIAVIGGAMVWTGIAHMTRHPDDASMFAAGVVVVTMSRLVWVAIASLQDWR